MTRHRDLAFASGDVASSTVIVSASLLATSLLGAAQALVLAFIAGSGPDTDAFFAAYAVYLPLAVLAASMRTSVVPLLGPVEDGAAFAARCRRVLTVCASVGLAGAALALACLPLLRATVTADLPASAQDDFVAVYVLLVVASYLHVHAALLSAVLVAARSFTFSAIAYPAAAALGVVMSALLLPRMGVAGAAVGVLIGTVALATSHSVQLARYGVGIRPSVRGAGVERRRTALYLVGNSSLGSSTQLNLAIALGALPAASGTITAYTYAFFIVLLLLNVTSLPISLVGLPDLVSLARDVGTQAVEAQLARSTGYAFAVLAPLAGAYLAFGPAILSGAFSGALDDRTIDVMSDVASWLCAFAVASVLLQLAHAAAVALGRWKASLAVNGGGVLVHLVVLTAAAGRSAETVAALHSAVALGVAVALAAALFRERAGRFLVAATRGALPAFALALVFAVPWALLGPEPSVLAAASGSVAGTVLYAGLTGLLRREFSAPLVGLVRQRSALR